jgi:hypothetical protein
MRKVQLSAIVGVILAAGVFGVARTSARAETACGLESVRGAYALYGTGAAFGSPWMAHGRFTFDGTGHSTGTMIESYGGVIDDGVLDGTYTMGPDCRGSASYDMQHTARGGGGAHEYRHESHRFDIVAAAGGGKVFWILTDTYPSAVPAGSRPHVDDATVTIGGWFERG